MLKKFGIIFIGVLGILTVWFLAKRPSNPTLIDKDSALTSTWCSSQQEYNYRLEYSSGGMFLPEVLSISGTPQTQKTDIQAQGTFTWHCEKTTKDEREISITFKAFEIRDFKDATPLGKETLNNTFYFRQSPDGVISKIFFPTDFASLTKDVLRDILSKWSFSMPREQKQALTWSAVETDLSGKFQSDYLAEYYQDKNEPLIKLVKKHLDYFGKAGKIRKSEDQIRFYVFPESKTSITLATDTLLIKSLVSNLKIDFFNNQKKFGSSTSACKLFLEGVQPKSSISTMAKNLDDSPDFAPTDLSASDRQQEIDRNMQVNTLGTTTFADLAYSLRQQEVENSTEIFLKLKALLFLEPAQAEELTKLIKELDPEAQGFHLGLSALVSIGSEPVQQALLNLLASIPPGKSELYLLSQIGLLEKPILGIEEHLRQIVNERDDPEVKLTARLALGNMGRSLQTEAPERQKRINDELTTLLLSPKTEDRYAALLALGNVGESANLALLIPLLDDGDNRIRIAAIKAMRFMEDESSEKKLDQIMMDEKKSAEDRLTAIQEFGYRHLSNPVIESHKKVLAKNETEQMVMAVLANLSAEVTSHPELMKIFENEAKTSPYRNVRNYCNMKLQQSIN